MTTPSTPSRIPAYQLDAAGMFIDAVPALESIAEPGQDIYHLPAGAVRQPMPADWITLQQTDGGFYLWLGHWPDTQWPRFDGHAWQLVARPTAQTDPTPAQKLAAYLATNPDVAALIATSTNSNQES
ncbi:MAG: hypothetical protein GAK30_01572 [Paracidovorax wautersii]|uniref:Uncharacterized protein n=1 Tax=Paracidovorax wautersii TaxID=1177982 RepID=A0A7V8FPQ4_9BURK|nr:MAG: hypothetical protein GAK30_01572 [Paracidovorax wautersii]